MRTGLNVKARPKLVAEVILNEGGSGGTICREDGH